MHHPLVLWIFSGQVAPLRLLFWNGTLHHEVDQHLCLYGGPWLKHKIKLEELDGLFSYSTRCIWSVQGHLEWLIYKNDHNVGLEIGTKLLG